MLNLNFSIPDRMLSHKEAAKQEIKNRWAGFDSGTAMAIYRDLSLLGTQSKAHYIVEFTPLSTAVALNDLPLIQIGTMLGGLLVTEADYPIIALDTDTKRVGAFNINQFIGYQAPEINLTFLETRQNDIITSLQQWAALIINSDGTFGLPATYAMYLDITMFDRQYGRDSRRSTTRFIVAPSMANNNLTASDQAPALIPVTFTQLRQFE